MPIELTISVIIFVSILFLILLINCMVQYSKLSKLKAIVTESFLTLEVFLEKRLEILINILDNCSEEAIKNKEIGNLLNAVTQVKQNIKHPRRYKLEANLDKAVQTSINYLKQLENGTNNQLLMNLNTVQSDINSTKNYYNNNVEKYNLKLSKFPSSMVAKMFGFKKEYYVK